MPGNRKTGLVDANVAQSIRVHRLAKGVSQTDLAEKIGVTFQQVQKYEKGTNRVTAGRLMQIAEALDVPLIALFEGVQHSAGKSTQAGPPLALLAEPDAMRLARAFSGILDPPIRRAVVALVESIASHPK
jgi:transcriptional regulator with XRE-family HTH domain